MIPLWAALVVDVIVMAGTLVVVSIPLAITGWAFLDAAKRPQWVWAFSGRRQVVWMAAIGFGLLTIVGGLAISGYYLTRVRPGLAALESGDLT